MKFDTFFPAFAIIETDGSGLYATSSKGVQVVGIDLGYVAEEGDFGELRVFFDMASWDIDSDGLIYTDDKFQSDMEDWLMQLGFGGASISYSEQGMQGYDFVSFDVDKHFLDAWEKMR